MACTFECEFVGGKQRQFRWLMFLPIKQPAWVSFLGFIPGFHSWVSFLGSIPFTFSHPQPTTYIYISDSGKTSLIHSPRLTYTSLMVEKPIFLLHSPRLTHTSAMVEKPPQRQLHLCVPDILYMHISMQMYYYFCLVGNKAANKQKKAKLNAFCSKAMQKYSRFIVHIVYWYE